MATYIIDTEFGPVYSLREARPGEDLTGKRTIELADDDAADYERSVANFDHWQNLLHAKLKVG